jgi:hypothetical protein
MLRNRSEKEDDREKMTVGDVLRAMEEGHPEYIATMLDQVQDWMVAVLSSQEIVPNEDDFTGLGERRFQGDPENLMGQLEWVSAYADLLPAPAHQKRSEAVVIAIGPIDVDEGLRIAVDHAALFARDACKRVWVVCDNWIVGDALRYLQHVTVLYEMGIHVRFLLVTPWGWTEIPLGGTVREKGYFPWRGEGRSPRNHSRGTTGEDAGS